MDTRDKDIENEIFKTQKTGSHEEPEEFKIIDYPIDRFLIKIKLTPNNEFIEVLEVKVNKDFLSHKQKFGTKEYHDVEEFYKD